MLFVFQHPIIDFRSLIDDNHRLPKPHWPDPENDNMIKFTGFTTSRFRGGTGHWSGEQKYCTSKRAIRFDDLSTQKIWFDDATFLSTECAFRRFNANGNFLAKFETGLTNKLEEYASRIHKKEFLNFLLKEYCKFKLLINNPLGTNNSANFVNCGQQLAQLYLQATTQVPKRKRDQLEDWWVVAGEPICIVELLDENDDVHIPAGARLIKEYPSIKTKLYHYWIVISKKQKVRAWIIKICDKKFYKDELIRDLRLNLLRINAEKEALRKMIIFLSGRGRKLIDSDDKREIVSKYLENISSKLLKEFRYGIEQRDILGQALLLEEKAYSGDLQTIKEALEPLNNEYLLENSVTLKRKESDGSWSEKPLNGWFTALLYLMLFIIISTSVVLITKFTSLPHVPVIIASIAILFVIIGAFILLHERKISENNFLKALKIPFEQLKLLFGRK